MRNLLPLFLDIADRDVLLVGGGPVAAAKLRQLLAAQAAVRIVSPEVVAEIDDMAAHTPVAIARRPFVEADVDGAWLVVTAATPTVNRQAAAAAQARRVFVNAADDPANASAYLSGIVRRSGVTIAISTEGDAPALTSLVREGLDAVLPANLADWTLTAREQRTVWRRDEVPMDQRKPLLLAALNDLYTRVAQGFSPANDRPVAQGFSPANDRPVAQGFSPAIPWLHAPEDSWL